MRALIGHKVLTGAFALLLLTMLLGLVVSVYSIAAGRAVEAAAASPGTCGGTCPTVSECVNQGGLFCQCSGPYPGTCSVKQ